MRRVRLVLLSSLLVLALGLWPGAGQVRLIGLYVVPTDYPTIRAALDAASDAGGGTIVILEGDYSEDIFIDFYERRDKKLRILGVGAVLNGKITLGCGAQGGEVEISGFQIYGAIEACAQDLGDLIMVVQGVAPDLEKLGGRLVLKGNSIEGDIRLKGFFGFNYELVMRDNMITGGVRVEIEKVASLKAQLTNNWVFGSAGEGVRLRLHYDPARPTLQSSAKLEGNVIVAHSSHGLVLEFSSESKQPTPVELIGNIIEQNGGCGIFVNNLALRLGAQLRGQANSVYLNGEGDFCPDPGSSSEAQKLFPSQLASTKVWRVCPQAGPNCDTTSIQEALNKAQRGDVIVVVPGIYAENLRVSGSRVIVQGRPSSAALASTSPAAQADRVVLQGKEGPGIVVEDGVVFLQGFTIQGFKERCLERQGDKCVKADPGDGIRQQGRAQLFLRDVKVLQNEGWGVRARGRGLSLEGVELSQNRAGGLALMSTASARLRGVESRENGADGVALFGPAARLQQWQETPVRISGNQGCGLAAYPYEPGIDPLALSRGAGRAPHVTGKGISLSANGTDLCGQLPKELRVPLAQPAQSSVELSCAQDRFALQKAVDSLQPGGRLRLRGTCPAGAVIDKPVIIEGSGADSTVIPVLALLAGAEVQLSTLNVAQLRVIPGAKVSAKQSKLAGIWIEGGELTAAESQVVGPIQLWGLAGPTRFSARTSQVQGELALWAVRHEVEAELVQTQVTGSKEGVGVRAVGGQGQARVLLQSSRVSGYKIGVVVAGQSFARLEGNTITANEVGVALALPLCPVDRPLPGGELEGLGNQISGNKQDFCPEAIKPLLTRGEARPARFTIEGLVLQPGSPLSSGTTATITAVVRNRGDKPDTKAVWLEVQNQRQGEQKVTVQPGARTRVDFSYTFKEAGSFKVIVRSPDGAAMTTVEVQPPPPGKLSVCCNLSFQAARGGPNPPPQRFTVSNRGGQPLNWTASADQSWVRLEPNRGALKPGESIEVAVTVEISGLPEGDQAARVTVSSPEATNSPRTLTVAVRIQPPPPARLEVQGELTFQAMRGDPDPEPKRFTIANRGGQPLRWTATVDQPWVRLSPESGALKPGEQTEVSVAVKIKDLPAGDHQAQITISSPEAVNTPQRLTVRLKITLPPARLEVCCDLHFRAVEGGPNPPAQKFTITNVGGQPLSWEASLIDGAWLRLSTRSGGLEPREKIEVTVIADIKDLPAMDRSAEIEIKSPQAVNSPQRIKVTLVFPRASLQICSDQAFQTERGINPPSQPCVIKNVGGRSLTWSASANQRWVRLAPTAGSLKPGESATMTISLDVTGLDVGNYTAQVTVSSSEADNSPQIVRVTLEIRPPRQNAPRITDVRFELSISGDSATGTFFIDFEDPDGDAAILIDNCEPLAQGYFCDYEKYDIATQAKGITRGTIVHSWLSCVRDEKAKWKDTYTIVDATGKESNAWTKESSGYTGCDKIKIEVRRR